MPSAVSASDAQELRRLIPLNTLSDTRFEHICSQIRIEEAPRGFVLFRQGDTKNEFVYLLSGTISLQAGGVEMDSVSGGTDTARFALAHQIPRKVSAVAIDAVRYVRIAPDIINQQDELNRGLPTYKVSDIPEEPTRDWMTALLKSPLFLRLSPANIQAILRGLEEIEVNAGDVVCRQGDPGDFYYIIKKGRCALTRKPSRLAKDIKLATLKTSDTFGEDSLISGDPRNVTVTMLTDGVLLRLDKANFIKLLKDPVISHVDFETAQRMASRDAVWLDVRTPDAYEQGRLPGSLNIPFFSLRVMLPTLNRQTKYLLVCDDGRLSEAAAFLLIRYGFEAQVVAGGIVNVPRDHLVVEATKWTPSRSLATTAYRAPQPEQSGSADFEGDTDTGENPDEQEESSPDIDQTADDEISQDEIAEDAVCAFEVHAPEEPPDRESESIDPPPPLERTPTLDALLAGERSENRGPEENLATLKHRLRELEASIQERLLREQDLARRLTDSQNRAAEAAARTQALEKQLAKANDIIASAAALTEQREQAENELLKAMAEIASLKAELEKVRELANDREAALRSLRENYEHLLAEQVKNVKAENNKGEKALSALKEEIERLKTINRLAIRDKASAERQAADLARQVSELQTAMDRSAGSAADANTLRHELESVHRRHADELAGMQARLRDMEQEGNRLRETLQLARTRLAVLESAAQAGKEDKKKKLHFEFAVSFPVTLAITLFLTALVFGGLFGTAYGRKLIGRLLAQTTQASLEQPPPKPMLAKPTQGL
jgi:CRP-like cAMP-binding protein